MPSKSDSLSLRPMTREDFPFVLALSRKRIVDSHLDEGELEKYLEEDFLSALLLLQDGRSIGYCLYRKSPYDGEIDEIAIAKDAEGKGIGRFFLDAVLKTLDDGCRREVFLEAREGNERARKLYERLSFEGYRRRINYYGSEDSICYRKEIGRK